jgi:hypothetical protein
MVIHIRFRVLVITEIYSIDFTALLTIIRQEKKEYFIFWRFCSGLFLSNLYQSG